MREPRVGALFFEPFHDVAQRGKILQQLAALLAIEHNQRHAPEALARNAPVGPLGHHLAHALLAPRGRPFHFLNFLERVLAQIVVLQIDEPLLRGAENHGIVAAPAVRIAVRQFAFADQRAASFEQLRR